MTTQTRLYESAPKTWEYIQQMETEGWNVRQIVSFDHLDTVSQRWGIHFFVVYEKDLT